MKKFLLRQRNRFDLLRFSQRILPAGLLVAFLLSTSLMMATPAWAQGGTFGPFNDMVINYSVSGASLDPDPKEIEDFTTSRIYTGQLTGRELRVSGNIEFGYMPHRIRVITTVDGVSDTQEFDFPDGERGRSTPFDVSVPIPRGATSGSFSISVTLHGSPYGPRTLVVSGSLTGPGPGASGGGGGSLLGPIAIVGTLGALGVLGVVGVVGAAAAAILVGVLKGGAAAGGAAAAVPGVGSVPDVAPDPMEDLLDELLDERDREIEELEEVDEAPEPETKKKPRRREDETDPETDALDEGEAPEAEEEIDDQGEGGQTETESTDELGESEAEAEIEDPGEEPETETEATDELGESEAEAEIKESGDAPDMESKEIGDPPQEKRVERKEDEVTIGAPSEGADWGEYIPDFEKEWITSQINSEIEKMKSEGYFIGNITNIKKVLNLTFGQVTNRIRGWNKSMYCQEMALWGTDHLNRILPNAHVSTILIARNGEMTHIANRVILEDGKEIIVDYWESLSTGEPKIYTPEQWLKKWEKELGEPWWGDWLNHQRIGDDQINMVEHIVKNGEGAVDNFAGGKKSMEPIRNWWKSIDQYKRREIQRDLFKTLPEDQKEVKARIMRYFRSKRI